MHSTTRPSPKNPLRKIQMPTNPSKNTQTGKSLKERILRSNFFLLGHKALKTPEKENNKLLGYFYIVFNSKIGPARLLY